MPEFFVCPSFILKNILGKKESGFIVILSLLLSLYSVDEGMESAFLGTRSGLMRVIRYAGSEKRVGK